MFGGSPIQPQLAFRVARAARALHFSLLGFFFPKTCQMFGKKRRKPKNVQKFGRFLGESEEKEIRPIIRWIFGTRRRAIRLSTFRRREGLVWDVCRSACVRACLPACLLARLPACSLALLPLLALLACEKATWLSFPPLRSFPPITVLENGTYQ